MRVNFRKLIYGLLASVCIFLSCKRSEHLSLRKIIDLKGEWQFQIDTAGVGISQKWYIKKKFTDNVILPGTLDQNKKGFLTKDSSLSHLTRIYHYYGAAWYSREVTIPQSWKGNYIELVMERTKVSHLWIDSVYIGSENSISVDQRYELSAHLSAGKHTITIMIDNSVNLVPVGGSHAYSDDTQTNWNGIIGKFYLQAVNPVRISGVKIYSEIHSKLVRVKVHIQNPENLLKDIVISLRAESWNSSGKDKVDEKKFEINLSTKDTLVELTYALNPKSKLWDENNPAMYKLFITLINKDKPLDNFTLNFGLSEFSADNSHFTINDTRAFLRGKLDACVFPMTGHPPMDVESWLRVFKIAKLYGINHYRFHTWCPPEAAFLAADMSGIYLQPELPNWQFFTADDTFHTNYMRKEGMAILDLYGEHPSFVALSLGNELGGDRRIMAQMVKDFRNYDNRRLYAEGSNNFFWNSKLAAGDDYWTTARTKSDFQDWSYDVRSSFAFCEDKEGGIINAQYPSTLTTYVKAINGVPVPVIGHEIGQYQIFPNYSEIPYYSGILQARNLEIFRQRLIKAGMIDQAEDFFKASGMLSVLCYREEIETAIRTPGFGGFQLLDLQDYPGQGTALVGLLNALMIDKDLIAADKFREFCNDVVPLLFMQKYCWTNAESFTAQVGVANYSSKDMPDKTIHWSIFTGEGKEISHGEFTGISLAQGNVTSVGKIHVSLRSIEEASKVTVRISIDKTGYKNEYPVWIYPSDVNIKVPEKITVSGTLDNNVIEQLKKGGKVLLFPNDTGFVRKSFPGLFTTDFWNYEMFRTICEKNNQPVSPGTMGILTNPRHHIFDHFPTEFYTDWQWWPIIKNSRSLILDSTDKNYRPIVQVIDNIYRNHKLGMIFEFKVEKGKILICTSNLPSITSYPEAKQLYHCILDYMQSDNFSPKNEVTVEKLKKLL